MLLYHISTDLRHDGTFVPRIPENRHQDAEDTTILRVSASPSIDDCLTAIPDGGTNLEVAHIDRKGYFKVFEIDTEKLAISDEDIVKPDMLFEKDLVRDADFTNEHWIQTDFTVPEEDQYLIRLNLWEETVEDVIPYSMYELAEEKYEGNYLQAYEEETGNLVPSSIRIYKSDYTREGLKQGEEVTLYYGTPEEKEAILLMLNTEYRSTLLDVSMDEITFRVNEDCNLRKLFLHHADVGMVAV